MSGFPKKWRKNEEGNGLGPEVEDQAPKKKTISIKKKVTKPMAKNSTFRVIK